jgi:hypothetical protein
MFLSVSLMLPTPLFSPLCGLDVGAWLAVDHIVTVLSTTTRQPVVAIAWWLRNSATPD